MTFPGSPDEYYPGSREKRQVNHVREHEPDVPPLGPGKIMIVAGHEVEMFGIGDLAMLLNRKPGTIRAWENEGILPRPVFSRPGRDGDIRGRRRLWTRPQAEGIWRIARDEGILHPGPHVNIRTTEFTSRVSKLFAELRRKGIRQ